jgi:hypothetical protein
MMRDLFKKKTVHDMKRENADILKDMKRQREYADIRKENKRLKEEQAKLKKQSDGLHFDSDGFMDGLDDLLGNKKPKKKRGSIW